MRFFTLVSELSLRDLRAMAEGQIEGTVTDMDFLETLAAHKCLLVPPWVMRVSREGGLARVTPLVYDPDGQIDKARVLLAAERRLRQPRSRFGSRFD